MERTVRQAVSIKNRILRCVAFLYILAQISLLQNNHQQLSTVYHYVIFLSSCL